MLGTAFMGYHLIQFTREALRGDQNASYYSTKNAPTRWRSRSPRRSRTNRSRLDRRMRQACGASSAARMASASFCVR